MAKRAAQPRDEGKTRFELRFDDELYAEIKSAADETGISVNQLMQGIARWAMKHAHPGHEADHDSHGEVRSKPQPGCIWFGDLPAPYEWTDPKTFETGTDVSPGDLAFSLDFTERHVVREPDLPARREDPEK